MHTSRLKLIKLGLFFVFFAVIARLYYWQIWKSDQLKAIAESQYGSTQEIHANRGRIFTSDGYALATNQQVYTLFAEPKKVTEDPQLLAATLATLLVSNDPATATDTAITASVTQLTTQDFFNKLNKKESSWVALKRKLPETIKKQIIDLKLAGLGFDAEEIRYYPEASMAAQLLGFVGSDAVGQPKGYFGIEGQYNRELQGKSGVMRQEKDALGLPIALGEFDTVSSKNGRDIVLTIRRDIQFMLEQKLQEGMQKYGAKNAEGVIMDPQTGAILAMAAFPQYDPASFTSFDPVLYKNPLISDGYEPGSTIKILTVSAGIDSGAMTPETACNDPCAQPRVISGYTIRTWDNTYHPGQTMTEALARSDNTAMMYASDLIGKDTFVQYLRKFGLGEIAHIDLQEEISPPFRTDWKQIDVATASFGQGISITGLQMLRIAQVIANRGVMMKPMLIQEVRDGISRTPIIPESENQVISAKTAEQVTRMMVGAAQHGDAKWAVPKGYVIAGKTGTAQVPVSGHYDENKTIVSFVGFAPANDPTFVMLIKLREPSTSQWGSETAAPLWFSIARDLFVRMNIPPVNL